jgi:phospholipid N-methyltransferase
MLAALRGFDRMGLTDSFLRALTKAGLPKSLRPTVAELDKVAKAALRAYHPEVGAPWWTVGLEVPGGFHWLARWKPGTRRSELVWERVTGPALLGIEGPLPTREALRMLTDGGKAPGYQLCLMGRTESYRTGGSGSAQGYSCLARIPLKTPTELVPASTKSQQTSRTAKDTLIKILEAKGWRYTKAGRYEYVTSPSDQLRVQLKQRNARVQWREGGKKWHPTGNSLGSIKDLAASPKRIENELIEMERRHAKQSAEIQAKEQRRREAEAKAVEIKREAERAKAHAEGVAKDLLVLRYSRPEGILLCGATRENKDKIKAVRYPKRFRFSRRLPDDCAWYVQRTRNVDFTKAQIDAVAKSLRDAGVVNLRVDYMGTGAVPDIASAARKEQAEHPWATPEQARRIAEDHAAAQLRAKDESEIRRELRELVGAGFEVRDAKRREKMAERVGQLDAELQRRKREQSSKARSAPKPVALTAAELKKLAELPKDAARDMRVAREARIKAFETAVEKGGVKAVRKLRALFRKQTRSRWDREFASNEAAEVIALDAMRRGQWPPPPERGGGYSESEWSGIERSLAELPSVKATVEQANRFDKDLAKVLRKAGVVKVVGDPTEGSGFWQNYPTPDREATQDLRPVRTPPWVKGRTPSSAKELRQEVEKSAQRHAKHMAVMLDPKVYDTKNTTAQQASKRLCEYSSEWSRRILARIYDVPFDHSYDGDRQSSAICDGETTVRKVRLKRARDELKTAHRHVTDADLDQAMAKRVLPVFADASKDGKRELTERRLNDALRRAGFKVSKADKYARAGGFGVSNYGPHLQLKVDDRGYYFSLPGPGAQWRKKSEDGYWQMLRAHMTQVSEGNASSTGIRDAPSDARKQVTRWRERVSELETPKATGLEVRKQGREWWLFRKLDRYPDEQLVRKFATKRSAELAQAILKGDTSQETVTDLARDDAKRAKEGGIRNPEQHAWEGIVLLMRNNGVAAPSWWPRRERELLAVKPGASVREFEQAADRGEVIALTGPGSLSEAIAREQKQKAKGPAKPKPLTAAQRKKRAAKLREAGEKAIAKGKADFEAPRKENTAKRIREAQYARVNAAKEMLLGEILLNAAKAVEAGKLDYMARVSTRKQVEALDRALRLGQWKRCGSDCKDEDPSSADIEYAKMPTHGGWEGEADLKRLAKLGVTTQAQLHAAIGEYLKCCRGGKTALKEDPIKAREQALSLKRIPGYFPPPRGIVERMVAAADIEDGDRVLEPSAGSGAIVEVIKDRHPDVQLDVVEFNRSLRQLLTDKGYTVAPEGDFLAFAKGKDGKYDAIVMNPPFEKGQDTTHIARALKLLAPGGRLVAIASGSFPSRSDRNTTKLRAELDKLGATIETLPSGTFKGAGTGVSTVLITAKRPAARARPAAQDRVETMAKPKKLNAAQAAQVKREMDIGRGVPVRFMDGGRALNISTGERDAKGINVINQTTYWDFRPATAEMIAKWLGVRAVFSKRDKPPVAAPSPSKTTKRPKLTRGAREDAAQAAGVASCPSDVYVVLDDATEFVEDRNDERSPYWEYRLDVAKQLYPKVKFRRTDNLTSQVTDRRLLDDDNEWFYETALDSGERFSLAKRNRLKKAVITRSFAEVLKALKKADKIAKQALRSKAGGAAREKYLAKLSKAEDAYRYEINKVLTRFGLGQDDDFVTLAETE